MSSLKPFTNSLLFCCVVFLPSISGAEEAPSPKVLDRIAAVVNDKVILLSEVQETSKKVAQEMGRRDRSDGLSSEKDRQSRVLDQLINDELVSAEAERRGLGANDGVIDRAIASVMSQNGMKSTDELKKALASEELTLETYRAQLKRQIETSRVMDDAVRSKVRVTDQDVEAALARQASELPKERMLRIRMIFKKKESTTRKKMDLLRKELEVGASFERLANRETEGPGKGEGGNVGFVSPGQMQPDLGKAVKLLKKGQLSPVIVTTQGFYIVECLDESMTAMPTTSSETDRAKIREELTQQETAKQFDAFVRSLREKAHVEVSL